MNIGNMAMLNRNSLSKEVSNQIEKKIRDGVYELNQKLPIEPELMKDYGVGRSTIREAVKYLVQLGYVEVKQGVGTFVSSRTGNGEIDDKLQKANFDDMSEIRQLLELKTVEKAAQNRSSEHLLKMKAKLDAREYYANTGDVEQCFQADIEFHIAVAESCGNELLFELYKILTLQLKKLYVDSFSDTAIFIAKNDLHTKLVEYIEMKDPIKALKVAREIIQTP